MWDDIEKKLFLSISQFYIIKYTNNQYIMLIIIVVQQYRVWRSKFILCDKEKTGFFYAFYFFKYRVRVYTCIILYSLYSTQFVFNKSLK